MNLASKKKVCRIVAVILAAVTLFGFFDTGNLITYAYTAQTGMIYSTDKSMVETKKAASPSAEKVNGLLYGKPVTVVDEVTGSDGSKWYKLTYDLKAGGSATGYCPKENVLLDKDATAYWTGKINANNVSLRNDAGTDGTTILAALYSGHRLELLDTTTVGSETWYRVRTTVSGTSKIGWVYGQYVTEDEVPDIETDADYKATLIAKGFPESYAERLAVLHVQYPNWLFEPVLTGLDWNTVISAESAAGKNLVHTSANDAKKSVASSEYNWTTNTWVIRDSSGWVTAHPDYIAYCMDPRNFLNATNIFMFESLSYSSNHTIAGVNAILSGTFMENDVDNGDETTLNYANAFMSVGKESGVSAYHLASRVRQEQGTGGTSPLISGTYTGYEGYYNYFNIKATGTPNSVLYANGLTYAKEQGWNTRYKSLLGGANFIGKNYIKVGQDTLYTQKFNVVNTSNLYGHQYMTNVTAAISESKTVASAYTDKSQTFVFRIPVYNNMPSEAVQFTASGSRNNYLSTLSVSGFSLTPTFTGATTDYTIIVGSGVSSITVAASPVVSSAKVTGTGTYNLSVGTNTITINCKSASGDTRTYKLTVVREASTDTNDYTLTSGKYKIDKYITGVEPGTSVSSFLSGFSCNGGTLKVLTTANTENTGTVGTGNKLAVYVNGTLVETKEIVIYGDVNGDGKVTTVDAIKLNRYTIGKATLSGVYLTAADASRDGKVNALDGIIINRYTIGLSEISQK